MLGGRGWVVVVGLVVGELEIQEDEKDEANDATGDEELHVLQPELVLQLARLLLELRRAILERVRPLVQLRQLGVPLKDLLHVVLHDADNLVDLGLLLCHPPLRHHLLHLLGSGQRFAIGTQGPPIRPCRRSTRSGVRHDSVIKSSRRRRCRRGRSCGGGSSSRSKEGGWWYWW